MMKMTTNTASTTNKMFTKMNPFDSLCINDITSVFCKKILLFQKYLNSIIDMRE